MKSLFVTNPEMTQSKRIIIWYASKKAQDIFCLLTTMGVKIDGFCLENPKTETFFGKKVYSVMSMIETGDYALICEAEDYDYITQSYLKYGLNKEHIYAWINETHKVMYV